jgi:hypothetical protein
MRDALIARIRAGGVAVVAPNDQSRAFRSTLMAAEFKALFEESAHFRRAAGGSVSVDAAGAAVVRRIFAEYAGTEPSTRAIACRLNAEGVPLPSFTSGWRADSVAQMLANPAYASTARAAFGSRPRVRNARTRSRASTVPPLRRAYAVPPPRRPELRPTPVLPGERLSWPSGGPARLVGLIYSRGSTRAPMSSSAEDGAATRRPRADRSHHRAAWHAVRVGDIDEATLLSRPSTLPRAQGRDGRRDRPARVAPAWRSGSRPTRRGHGIALCRGLAAIFSRRSSRSSTSRTARSLGAGYTPKMAALTELVERYRGCSPSRIRGYICHTVSPPAAGRRRNQILQHDVGRGLRLQRRVVTCDLSDLALGRQDSIAIQIVAPAAPGVAVDNSASVGLSGTDSRFDNHQFMVTVART